MACELTFSTELINTSISHSKTLCGSFAGWAYSIVDRQSCTIQDGQEENWRGRRSSCLDILPRNSLLACDGAVSSATSAGPLDRYCHLVERPPMYRAPLRLWASICGQVGSDQICRDASQCLPGRLLWTTTTLFPSGYCLMRKIRRSSRPERL